MSGSMLGRGLDVLRVLGARGREMRLSELATEAGLPVSTMRRLLQTMLAADFVAFDPARHSYTLGMSAFLLANRVAPVERLREAAGPAMRRVVDVTGEQVLLGARHHTSLVYLDKRDGPRQVQNHVRVGGLGPLDRTALGKALLAALPTADRDQVLDRLPFAAHPADLERLRAELARSRHRGFTLNDEENEVGVRSVAVWIMDQDQRPVGALCVTAPVFRMSRADLERCVPLLLESAEDTRAKL